MGTPWRRRLSPAPSMECGRQPSALPRQCNRPTPTSFARHDRPGPANTYSESRMKSQYGNFSRRAAETAHYAAILDGVGQKTPRNRPLGALGYQSALRDARLDIPNEQVVLGRIQSFRRSRRHATPPRHRTPTRRGHLHQRHRRHRGHRHPQRGRSAQTLGPHRSPQARPAGKAQRPILHTRPSHRARQANSTAPHSLPITTQQALARKNSPLTYEASRRPALHFDGNGGFWLMMRLGGRRMSLRAPSSPIVDIAR